MKAGASSKAKKIFRVLSDRKKDARRRRRAARYALSLPVSLPRASAPAHTLVAHPPLSLPSVIHRAKSLARTSKASLSAACTIK